MYVPLHRCTITYVALLGHLVLNTPYVVIVQDYSMKTVKGCGMNWHSLKQTVKHSESSCKCVLFE